MKTAIKLGFIVYTLAMSFISHSQTYYFPPTNGTWAATDPATFGITAEKRDELYSFLEDRNTKAFILLIDGKIVLEKYFGTYTQDSSWYWASAGKSVTSFLIGTAQEKNLLSLEDPASDYLGDGWTNTTTEQEKAIKIKHQLSMSTGLDWQVSDQDCLLPECLDYKSPPNTEWYYYNAPYRLLLDVIEAASGRTINAYSRENLFSKIGMSGLWFNSILYGKARDMARFGSLVLNKGIWEGQTILGDEDYVMAMSSSSQIMNPAYGYLWWLNGKTTFVQPGLPISFSGKLIPNAPDDLFAALGKNDQKLYIIPSKNMVVIRQGNKANEEAVLAVSGFDDELWGKINVLFENSDLLLAESNEQMIYPNPTNDILFLDQVHEKIKLYTSTGQIIMELENISQIPLSDIASGTYLLHLVKSGKVTSHRVVVK